MGQIAKVVNIIDPEFKSGTSVKGKPWSIAKVELDNGKTTNIFAPIKVGDVVESFKDEKSGYWNWKLAKQGAYDKPQAQPANTDALRELYKLNLAIYKAVTGSDYKSTESSVERTTEAPVQSELPPTSAYDDLEVPEDISGIPF